MEISRINHRKHERSWFDINRVVDVSCCYEHSLKSHIEHSWIILSIIMVLVRAWWCWFQIRRWKYSTVSKNGALRLCLSHLWYYLPGGVKTVTFEHSISTWSTFPHHFPNDGLKWIKAGHHIKLELKCESEWNDWLKCILWDRVETITGDRTENQCVTETSVFFIACRTEQWVRSDAS